MRLNFKEEIKRIRIKNVILLTLAGIINAIGITLFLEPVSLYDSGISGTSMLLGSLVPKLGLSVFLIILNVPLFLYGLKREGICFTLYAIYTVCIYSLMAFIIKDVLPIDVENGSSPIAGTDLLLCAIFGGLISGIGSGLAIRFGGAMDGMEVMAVIFAKKIGITVGTFVMSYNVILYVVCGILAKAWELSLYSVIAYAVGLKAVDFIVEGFDKSKAVLIVTERQKEVCAALSEEFGTGITVMNAKGYYSDSDKSVIYFVVNRFQIAKMRDTVQRVDEKAYLSVSEVSDVFKSSVLPKR